MKKRLMTLCSILFLCSCQMLEQEFYVPYFVYQTQLNKASLDDDFAIISKINRKQKTYIFYHNFVYCYYKGNRVPIQTFLDLYNEQTGCPNDYSVEIWYNLFEIPCFKVFEWKAQHFNHEIDILIR
ncbi:MAG: hypothetical protein IJA81_02505 [Akkermansia sp.]|nr:hypothetical protein [Akkermansia sp.]